MSKAESSITITINTAAALHSDAAKQVFHNIERKLLKDKLYILNIQENHHPLALTRKLKELRDISKNAALKNNNSLPASVDEQNDA